MIVRLPPELTLRVTPDATLNGPVAEAFSVARIVVSLLKVWMFTLNIPSALNLPLNVSSGTTESFANAKKFTKMLPVPDDGASENVRVVPSDAIL